MAQKRCTRTKQTMLGRILRLIRNPKYRIPIFIVSIKQRLLVLPLGSFDGFRNPRFLPPPPYIRYTVKSKSKSERCQQPPSAILYSSAIVPRSIEFHIIASPDSELQSGPFRVPSHTASANQNPHTTTATTVILNENHVPLEHPPRSRWFFPPLLFHVKSVSPDYPWSGY